MEGSVSCVSARTVEMNRAVSGISRLAMLGRVSDTNVALAEVDKKKESICLAEVKKPRDFTRLTQENDSLPRGNLCNLVVS